MDNSTIKILVKMPKIEPTGIKERPCRKVSFVTILRNFFGESKEFRYYLNLHFSAFNLSRCSLRGRVKAFDAIPRYRDHVYDPDPEKSYTKAKVEKLKTGAGQHSTSKATEETRTVQL